MSHIHPALPTGAELRAIGRRYRPPVDGGTNSASARREGRTADWLEAVDSPFETVEGTLSRLEDVEATFRARGDRRAVFLSVYTQMTRAVQDGIDSGFFEDAAWVERYLVTFAEQYRAALTGYERGDDGQVPQPWRVAFDASLGDSTVVLQDALLGVNAHINYDLTYTLAQLGLSPDRPSKRRDHDRINEILSVLVDAVQNTLVSVYGSETVEDLDARLGATDESLAYYGLREGRRFAWENAVLLQDYRVPLLSRYVDWRVRSVSTGAAYVILAPSLQGTVHRATESRGGVDRGLESYLRAFREEAPTGDPAGWAARG